MDLRKLEIFVSPMFIERREALKAQVDQELCVGCGLCADSCPDAFVMEQDKAQIKADPVPTNAEECCKKVKEDCPVEAIKIEE